MDMKTPCTTQRKYWL